MCKMSFKSPRNLKRHQAVHQAIDSGERQDGEIFCQICAKSFSKHASLSAHLIMVHRRVRKHKCSECDKIFGKKSNLINHMRFDELIYKKTHNEIDKVNGFFIFFVEHTVARSLSNVPHAIGNLLNHRR